MSFVEDETSDSGVDSRSRLESYVFSKINSDAFRRFNLLAHVEQLQLIISLIIVARDV